MVQSQGRLSEDIKFDGNFSVNHWELYELHHCKLHYNFIRYNSYSWKVCLLSGLKTFLVV